MQRGDLVFWSRDQHYRIAANLCVVGGHGKPDEKGGETVSIVPLLPRRRWYAWELKAREYRLVLAADCEPLESYGFRLATVDIHPNDWGLNRLTVARDPALAVTATRKWGSNWFDDPADRTATFEDMLIGDIEAGLALRRAA